MKRDHLLGFFQVNEFTAPTPAEKKRIHLARVSHALAREDKLRRAYSGGNVISAREKDKTETATRTVALEKPPKPEPSPDWSTGKPNMWGKFRARLKGGVTSLSLVFYKGFWYSREESCKGLNHPRIKAEHPSARCSQNWEWTTIPGEHYLLPNGTAAVETKPTFDPMTEPLQVGDLVEVLHPDHPDTGKQKRITHLPEGGHLGWRLDNKQTGWAFRSSLKLLEKGSGNA